MNLTIPSFLRGGGSKNSSIAKKLRIAKFIQKWKKNFFTAIAVLRRTTTVTEVV